jgi:beta-glucosidase/6-phospho-beta-glucosidase/beta-galactosidase
MFNTAAHQVKSLRSVSGSSDFFGLNYYTSFMVKERRAEKYTPDVSQRLRDGGHVDFVLPEWEL